MKGCWLSTSLSVTRGVDDMIEAMILRAEIACLHG